jgi:hypothetical protein
MCGLEYSSQIIATNCQHPERERAELEIHYATHRLEHLQPQLDHLQKQVDECHRRIADARNYL